MRTPNWCSLMVTLVVSFANVNSHVIFDHPTRNSTADCPKIAYFSPDYYFPLKTTVRGGQRAFVGEFPHMAAIGWTSEGNIRYRCGGTLITSNFVLTAAHCWSDGNGNAPDTVRLGDTNVESFEDDNYSQQIGIRAFRRHPQYRPSKKYFDIALIELETEAKFNEAICPACLWLETSLPSEPMESVGFGANGLEFSPTLQKVKLSAIHKQMCLERLAISTRQLPRGLVDEQFCASSDTMDTCRGDSGGPIETKRVDIDGNVYSMVVGIVSFGSECVDGSVGAYTKVAPYREWIESEIQKAMNYSVCTRKNSCGRRSSIATGFKKPPFSILRVGLLWNLTDHNPYQCGATVIDRNYALTSAFCVKKNEGPPKFVIFESSIEIVEIDRIIIHPEYNPKRPENDIALIKFSAHEQDAMLCLAGEAKIQSDRFKNLYFSAYTLDDTSDILDHHFMIPINATSTGKCKDPKFKRRNVLCGDNSIDLIPTMCNMDYGGPIVNIHHDGGLSLLYGVVSKFNRGCGYDLFGTRVSPHIEWIDSVVFS